MRNPAISIRTSIEIGFAEGELPERYCRLRGVNWRAVDGKTELPYEDGQFQVAFMHERVLGRHQVKEAHRVLKKDGSLYFTVRERSKDGVAGFTLPEIYSMLRDGFNLVEIERTPFWRFWDRPRMMAICAQKKNWRELKNSYRPYVV